MREDLMRRIGTSAIAAALLLGAAACGTDEQDPAETGEAPTSTTAAVSTTTTAATEVTSPAPEGLPAFYGAPDPIPDAEPGTLLRSEEIPTTEIPGTAYRVMYASESLQGEPIVVTGVVAVPDAAAPDGGFPVVAWAHGTTGIADECAPSLDGSDSIPAVTELLTAGYVVTATDYEGLGTPGRHPYIAGDSEARGVLDSVRAAGQLHDVELSGQYAVWGHSQGGHAAMFALDIADDYAPELDLVGVVAGAPPSQFDLLYSVLQASPFRYYLLMASAGLNAAYGDEAAPLDEVIAPEGLELVDVVDEGCDLGALTEDLDFAALLGPDPATIPAWATLLAENDPGKFTEPSEAPLLIIHGGDDEQIPVAASALMFDQLCAIGQDETRWVYPGQSHAGVVEPSFVDMLGWIDRRFGGEPTPDATAPTGVPDVEAQACPAP
jgi:pimeloyl-ACP methyl ester carboxylesterase